MNTESKKPRDYAIVKVNPTGRFDLTLGAAIWRRCQPESSPCREYVFDLAGITQMHPSGVVWLRMFKRWANGSGATVHLVGPNEHVERSCREGQLSIAGDAADFIGDQTLEISQEELYTYN